MKLGKHIFKVGGWTAVSRILGFVRDVLIANVLGAGRLSDIFLAAFKLPNLFRDLLGEGALSAVFVPMFAQQRKGDENAAGRFANNFFSWLMAVLLGITIIGLIAMPIIIWILAPGFADDPGKMQMTVEIGRWLFLYLIFICGSAFLGSILNAFSEFALVASMPVLFNLFSIGALVLAMRLNAETGTLYILSAAVVLSGVVQMSVLWGRLRARKFGLRLMRPKWNGQIRTAFRRLGVGLVGSGFYQLNIIIGTMVASFQAGAVTWLFYSDRMVQLPFAIIGLAAGTVLLTSISNALAEKNMTRVYVQQNAAMRQSLMLTLPCMAGLIALAKPIMQFLFEHGAWTHESTLAVAAAIMIQALVLPVMTTSQIYSKTLYAAQDVKTPVRTSVIGLIVSSGLYLGLFAFIGYLAIPVGIVVGGYVKNLLLLRECRKRDLFRILPGTKRAVAGFAVLSAVLAVGIWFVPIDNIFKLFAAIGMYGILYLPCAWIINKSSK
ncbi:MAG: murein biosynthesis integral membrane protein MurJ [Alphaproteobacteria bacterium]|nr:murein biosynthesis integral membrane protein MurJ [Alphaproteobacteria bacterium]